MNKYVFLLFLSAVLCCCQNVQLSASEKVLFSDDFSSMDNWQLYPANKWEAKDNIAECDGGIAFIAEKDWSDYIFEVSVRSLGSSNPIVPWHKAYIYFRVQNSSNFYRFGIHGDAQAIELNKCVNNEWSTIARFPITARKNKWYKYRIELTGEKIKCYVDDKFIFDAKDQTFLQGSVGIGTADDKMLTSYKDLKVTEVDPNSYSPLEISLSQYQSIRKEIVANACILKSVKTIKFSSPKIKADLIDQNGKIVKTNFVESFDSEDKAAVPISIAGVAPGEYTVNISVSDKGKVILSSSQKVNVLDLSWESSKAGISDEVLPPWTPIVMDGLKVNLWGRTYDFSNSFLPSSIQTAGKSILAAPIKLNLNIDGKDVALSAVKPTIVSKSKSKIVLKSNATQDSVNISANVIIEYDGMIRIDLNIDPKTEATINNMVLDIPIKKEFAELYYSMFSDMRLCGVLGAATKAFPFWPYIWVGTDDLGMNWFADSNEYWNNKRPRSAIQIRNDDDQFTMRITFVDKPLAINKPITYTFGMQATPVKAFDKNFKKVHYMHHAYYGMEKPTVPGKLSPLEKIKKMGVNVLVFHESWADSQNYPETSRGAELKSLVEACHKLDMKILVYFGYEISDRCIEFAGVKDEVLVKRTDQQFSNWVYSGRGPTQSGYMVCYNTPWADFLANGIKHIMDKYGIDGVYLDSTVVPWSCPNEVHGCGYRDAEGKLHETWNIFAAREIMKRIYTICVKNGGIVNAHNQEMDATPILGFCNSYWDGEVYQDPLGAAKDVSDFLKIMPLEMCRVLFDGRKMGIPSELIVYPKGKWTFEAGLAMALLFDMPVRPFVNSSGKIPQIWKIWDDFGITDANCTFLPYWKNQDYVKVSNEGAYSSLYFKPGNSALVVVSNLSNEDQDINVTLNFKKLGIKKPKVSDAFDGEEIELQKNGDILVPTGKFRYKLLIVK